MKQYDTASVLVDADRPVAFANRAPHLGAATTLAYTVRSLDRQLRSAAGMISLFPLRASRSRPARSP